MATPLEVSVGRDPRGVPVVVAVGEIDMSNAARFREALEAAADASGRFGGSSAGAGGFSAGAGSSGSGAGVSPGGAGGSSGSAESFLVDLSAVEYLDSAGINALFGHVSRVRIIAPPLLLPVLNVSGLGEITSVRESSE